MRLTSDIFERLPQVWVLLGLLIISTGVYVGFDYSVVFVYLAIGIFCFFYGLALFALRLLDGPSKANTRPLSRNFISAGATVIMPAPQANQEPVSST
jgi:hypothetical protein